MLSRLNQLARSVFNRRERTVRLAPDDLLRRIVRDHDARIQGSRLQNRIPAQKRTVHAVGNIRIERKRKGVCRRAERDIDWLCGNLCPFAVGGCGDIFLRKFYAADCAGDFRNRLQNRAVFRSGVLRRNVAPAGRYRFGNRIARREQFDDADILQIRFLARRGESGVFQQNDAIVDFCNNGFDLAVGLRRGIVFETEAQVIDRTAVKHLHGVGIYVAVEYFVKRNGDVPVVFHIAVLKRYRCDSPRRNDGLRLRELVKRDVARRKPVVGKERNRLDFKSGPRHGVH